MRKLRIGALLAMILGLAAGAGTTASAAPIGNLASVPDRAVTDNPLLDKVHWRGWRHCHWRHGWRRCHGDGYGYYYGGYPYFYGGWWPGIRFGHRHHHRHFRHHGFRHFGHHGFRGGHGFRGHGFRGHGFRGGHGFGGFRGGMGFRGGRGFGGGRFR